RKPAVRQIRPLVRPQPRVGRPGEQRRAGHPQEAPEGRAPHAELARREGLSVGRRSLMSMATSSRRRAAQRRVRLVLIACSGLFVPSPLSIHSQSRFESFRLASDSPLATDGTLVYGVADDHRTILVSPGASNSWEAVSVRPSLGRISGLAWIRDSLYVADEASRAIYRV